MGSWWLYKSWFSAHLWNPHVPNKNSSTDSDKPWIPKCPVKGSLHLLYWRVCGCIVQVTMVAKKKRGNGKRRGRLFFGEFWSTTLGTTELWEHFLVGQVFSHFSWDFPDGEAPFEVFEALTSGFRGGRRHGNQLKVGSEALLPFCIRWKDWYFFLSKTKSTRSFDEWRGWWIDRS